MNRMIYHKVNDTTSDVSRIDDEDYKKLLKRMIFQYHITGNWRDRKYSQISHKSLFARKHSRLPGNLRLIVMHNFCRLF